MIDRIRELERIARRLEPLPHERHNLTTQVVGYADKFLNSIYEIPAYITPEHKADELYNSPITEDPTDIHTILRLIEQHVDYPGLNPASGGHLGYIPGGGIYSGALGDYLADVTNRFAGIYFASPGAVHMENMLIDWMASIVGFPETTVGNLTSGGSIANLIGIVTAREAQEIKARDVEKSAIYLTDHAHHSVDKAIRIAGLKESVIRHVPMDERYRMRADILEKTIVADRQSGLKPWLVIASAGTTDVGAIDPLTDIGEIAHRHHCWFHVDAAYGGFFVLCEEGKQALRGMETADSLVMDPHKGLFLPYGTGAVLVKDEQQMYKAHYYVANYMQDANRSREELSPADLSPELTKHFRGMRLWLSLKLFGVAPFRACLEEKLLLARYFYEQLQKIDGFEVGPAPELSVVTFRYLPKHGDADTFNRHLVEAIHRDGRVFLSSTMIDGKFTLRLAALAFRTHLATVDLAIEMLKEKIEILDRTL